MTQSHRATLEIDTEAMIANMRGVRARITGGRKFIAVIKGDAYGTGAVIAARAAQIAGADGLATGSPEVVADLRAAGVTLPVLLYPCVAPGGLAALAAPDVALTVHDAASMDALMAADVTAEVWLKLECGNGRLGIAPPALAGVLALLRRAPRLHLSGVYSQFRTPDMPDAVADQQRAFEGMVAAVRSAGFTDTEVMVSSSILVTDHPVLDYTAVNPGRMLFGILDPERFARFGLRAVYRALLAPLIQVRDLRPDESPYGHDAPDARVTRAGVLPIGFMDGYASRAGAPALVNGVRTAVLGPSSMDHTVIDLSSMPDARPGDPVTLLGSAITPEMYADGLGDQPIRLLPRLGRMAHRTYTGPLRSAA